MTTRALVLGGGGSTGNAWLIGVVAGLYDGGLDVTGADLLVGTSAGATAAAQIAGASPATLFAATRQAPPQAGSAPRKPVGDHLERLRATIAGAADIADLRRRLGAAALERAAAGDPTDRWHETVAARLPSPDWPERNVLITAVDAVRGEPVVFDRHSGVSLADAVAASCSSSFAYRIGEGRYIDGGYRTNAENADLAAGYERVLVLSPFGGRSLHPPVWGTHLATQVDQLREAGSQVGTVFPGTSEEHLFGVNAMDLSLRPAAAQAGFDQGRARAAELADLWR